MQIAALQIRTNTAANKVNISRGKTTNDVLCRKCGAMPETVNHILGQCLFTKPSRIKRHDDIKYFIEEKLLHQVDTVVSTEASFTTASGDRLKPDLVVKCQEGVLVVDITVRHEDGPSLRKAAEEKIDKYQPILNKVARQFEMTEAATLPVVVGISGAMPLQP